jgi:hypothetical protein
MMNGRLLSISRFHRVALTAVFAVVGLVVSSCAVAPTNDAGELLAKKQVKKLQQPTQQRFVYFLEALKLRSTAREVLISDNPSIVTAALIEKLRQGKRADDRVALDNQFKKGWKLSVAQIVDRTVTINISGGREIAENGSALCQLLATVIDNRVIRDVRLVDGVNPVAQVYSLDEERIIPLTEPLGRSFCSTLDVQRPIKLLFVDDTKPGGKLKYREVVPFNYDPKAEILDQVSVLISELDGDVALVGAELRSEPDASGKNAYLFSLNAQFEKLSQRRQAIVLTRLLDAVEQLSSFNVGAVRVEVSGVNKGQVPGPDGLIATPIQRSAYRSLLPAEEAALDAAAVGDSTVEEAADTAAP